jgi:hypothetical protein
MIQIDTVMWAIMTHIKTIATKKSRASDVQVTFSQSFQLGVNSTTTQLHEKQSILRSINSTVRYGEDEMEKITVSLILEYSCWEANAWESSFVSSGN